jgi:hypothetical protein
VYLKYQVTKENKKLNINIIITIIKLIITAVTAIDKIIKCPTA